MSDVKRLLNAGQVAKLLSVPESWVREQTRKGKLPCVELGRYRRYRLEHVIEWIDKQERNSA
jgi:excisionase family DNA binding protein